MKRVWVEISLKNLRANLKKIRARVGRRASILVVVKSDAYGHGMVPVARALAGAPGPVLFGIGRPGDASRLRQAGITQPLVMLGPFLRSEVVSLVKYGVTPTVSDWDGALALDQAAKAGGRTIGVHLKVDTGMGRVGVWHEEAFDFADNFRKLCPHLELDGLMTHFSDADSVKDGYTKTQIKIFTKLARRLERHRIRPRFMHAANTAGILRYPTASFNMVRPGLGVYGVQPPFPHRSLLDLSPVLTWKARVTLVREIPRGRFISYRRSYCTRRRTRIATLSVGYADGYPVSLSNRGRVLIRGKRAPVIGRVTMDQTLADVSRIPGVCPGDEVVLIGRQGRAEIRAQELAERAGTIPYELLCGIHSRIPRLHNKL